MRTHSCSDFVHCHINHKVELRRLNKEKSKNSVTGSVGKWDTSKSWSHRWSMEAMWCLRVGNSIQKPLRSELFSVSKDRQFTSRCTREQKGKMTAGIGMVCMNVLHIACVCIFVFAMEFQELDAVAQASLAFLSLTVDGCWCSSSGSSTFGSPNT